MTDLGDDTQLDRRLSTLERVVHEMEDRVRLLEDRERGTAMRIDRVVDTLSASVERVTTLAQSLTELHGRFQQWKDNANAIVAKLDDHQQVLKLHTQLHTNHSNFNDTMLKMTLDMKEILLEFKATVEREFGPEPDEQKPTETH